MNNFKSERGVTIIIVGITIVIMSIMATVLIEQLISDDGVLRKQNEIESKMQNNIQITENKISNIQQQWGNVIN